jgi:hypothetical protein
MSNNSPNNRPLTPRNRQLTRKNRNNSNPTYIVKLAELPPLSELERRVIICEEILRLMQKFNDMPDGSTKRFSLKLLDTRFILLSDDMTRQLGYGKKFTLGIGVIGHLSRNNQIVINNQGIGLNRITNILPEDISFLDTTPITYTLTNIGSSSVQTIGRGTVGAISFETISQTLFETRLQIYEFKRSRKINGMNALNWSQQAFEPGQY